VNYTCPTNGTNNCTNVTCLDWTGCTLVPKVCTVNASSRDCSTVHCDLATGDCVSVAAQCFTVSSAVIVAAAVTTAAVVGIIIGIIACVGLSGGATFAVYSRYQGDGLAAVTNNPLFRAAGKDKVNPLYAGNV